MTTIIELNDLRHSINRALNLGRYQIVVKTAGAEQVPASITLDLLERDDDGFAFPTETTSDDHGAAIPEQAEQRAAIRAGFDGIVDDLRTMRDMTALGEAITEVASGAVERRSAPGKWRVYREGGKVIYETFDQPEPAAEPMPPVGPLTSTEGLKAGDVLRVVFSAKHGGMLGFEDGALATFTQPNSPKGLGAMMSDGEEHWWDIDRFAFVARPGVWMPWEGGENPVPGLNVMCRYEEHPESGPHASKHIIWSKPWAVHSPELNVTGFMVVDTPSASSET